MMAEVETAGKVRALDNLFSFFDPLKQGFITAAQVQILHAEMRIGGISMSQVLAAIEYQKLNRRHIYLSDIPELLQELDRRYFLVQDLKWEFAMLDANHIGRIPTNTARFLMEARHGSSFSERSWERFLSTRPIPDAPITFSELEVQLCNKTSADVLKSSNQGGDDEKRKRREQERLKKQESRMKLEIEHTEQEKNLAEEKQRSDSAELEREKREIERQERELSRQKDEEEARRLAEEHAKSTKEAELKEQEAKEEAEQAAHQEKMLLDAARREKHKDKKREAEKKLLEARKRAEEAKKRHVRTQLKFAVETRNSKTLPNAVQDFKDAKLSDDDGDLEKAERLLKMFKCAKELKDGMTQRLIQKLEDGLENARKDKFDRKELRDLVMQAEHLLTRLRRLEKLRHEVLELKSSTIAEIRSYQKPPQVVHDVMMATYLLLGTPFKETKTWSNVQILLTKTGRDSLKRRISLLNVNDVDRSVAKKALNQMGEIDLETIRDVSAGAATFYVWVDGLVTEVLTDTD